MLSRLKQYFWIALAIGSFYYLLSHHFVFSDLKTFDILNKKELTLKYTFFNLGQSTPEEVLRIKELRDAGIEEILLKRGRVTENKLDQIMRKIEAQ
ncbi:MAG: hypothetical protein M0036_20535 [Desulfobacteraceae bacterium]|nr:hypothetical protein [Desulfobacteraceae bacterium]